MMTRKSWNRDDDATTKELEIWFGIGAGESPRFLLHRHVQGPVSDNPLIPDSEEHAKQILADLQEDIFSWDR